MSKKNLENNRVSGLIGTFQINENGTTILLYHHPTQPDIYRLRQVDGSHTDVRITSKDITCLKSGRTLKPEDYMPKLFPYFSSLSQAYVNGKYKKIIEERRKK